jgi:cytidine deaminase, homotetrameric
MKNENKNIVIKEKLIEIAFKALDNAYAPYSNFKVGAALLCENGKIYEGCNIENASYSATNCAERTAFCNAVSAGERDFKAIAIVAANANGIVNHCMPCGICRQVILEFAKNQEFKIFTVNADNEIKTFTIAQLLPYSFSDELL